MSTLAPLPFLVALCGLCIGFYICIICSVVAGRSIQALFFVRKFSSRRCHCFSFGFSVDSKYIVHCWHTFHLLQKTCYCNDTAESIAILFEVDLNVGWCSPYGIPHLVLKLDIRLHIRVDGAVVV